VCKEEQENFKNTRTPTNSFWFQFPHRTVIVFIYPLYQVLILPDIIFIHYFWDK